MFLMPLGLYLKLFYIVQHPNCLCNLSILIFFNIHRAFDFILFLFVFCLKLNFAYFFPCFKKNKTSKCCFNDYMLLLYLISLSKLSIENTDFHLSKGFHSNTVIDLSHHLKIF